MTAFTASYLTLAGSKYGEPAVWPVTVRSDAARAAGFASIGACADEVLHAGMDYHAISDATGPCPVTELEWYDLGEPYPATRNTLCAMATGLGATRVNVGICDPDCHVPLRTLASRLRHFAAQAQDHGLTVAVEPVSFGSYWSPARVRRLIEAAGMPNVGFLWDMYQLASARRREMDHEPLSRDCQPVAYPDLTAGEIAEVQLAGYGPSAMERSSWSYAADEQSTILRDLRYSGPVSVEVTNSAARQLNPYAMATAAMATVAQYASTMATSPATVKAA